MLSLIVSLSIAVAATPTTCPWAEDPVVRVHADMTNVFVNGIPYGVRGEDARTSFTAILEACGGGAVEPFTKWRAKRRRINIAGAGIAGIGGLIPFVDFVAIPVGGIWAIIELAGVQTRRDAVVHAIEDEAEASRAEPVPGPKSRKKK